jgi:hypothetical protein
MDRRCPGRLACVEGPKKDVWIFDMAMHHWSEVITLDGSITYDVSNNAIVLFNQAGETWTLTIEFTK